MFYKYLNKIFGKMNATIKNQSRFVSSFRHNANVACYPLVLANDLPVILPFGTLVRVTFNEGQACDFHLGDPLNEREGERNVRRIRNVENARIVSVPAGTEYTLPPEQDNLGLLKATDRQQQFVFAPGTVVSLVAGSQLHNNVTHFELKEICNVTLV